MKLFEFFEARFTDLLQGAKSVFDEWAKVSGNEGLLWRNLLQDFRSTTQLDTNDMPSNFSQALDLTAYGTGPLSLTRALTLDGFDPNWVSIRFFDPRARD